MMCFVPFELHIEITSEGKNEALNVVPITARFNPMSNNNKQHTAN